MEALTYGDITITVEEITPATAKSWLKRSRERDRALSKSRVVRYAQDMTDGNWLLSDQAISFHVDGRRANGQHRLMACVESNVSFTSIVVRGLPNDSFAVLDEGKARTFADALRIHQEVRYVNVVAAAVRILWQRDQSIPMCSGGVGSNPSNTQCLRFFADNPQVEDSAVETHAASVAVGVPHSIAAAAHYLFIQADTELCEWFFARIEDGVGLSEGDSVRHLRNRFLGMRGQKARLPRREMLALTIKAWNHLMEGREVRYLRWRSVGPQAEPFPLVAGLDYEVKSA